MKKALPLFIVSFFFYGNSCVFAQEKPIENAAKTSTAVAEEEGTLMLRFEPDVASKIEERKTEIAKTRQIIDSLQISERRRLKLIKDLYKNGVSKRLKKALLVEAKFEDVADQ